MCIGHGIEDGMGAFVSIWVFYTDAGLFELRNPEVLWTHYFGILMEASSCRHGRFLNQSLAPLSQLENGS